MNMKKRCCLALLSAVSLGTSVAASANLIDAITLAEQYSQGYAFKAEREDRYGQQYYSVEVSNQAGQASTLWIDMNQRAVVGVQENFTSPEMINANSYWFTSIENHWNITLKSAVIKSERMTGYQALRADYELGDQYEIDLVDSKGREIEIMIDAENDYGH